MFLFDRNSVPTGKLIFIFLYTNKVKGMLQTLGGGTGGGIDGRWIHRRIQSVHKGLNVADSNTAILVTSICYTRESL